MKYLKLVKRSWQIAHLKKQSQHIIKWKNISHGVRILNLSVNELKLVAKSRSIKGYKSMTKERLLSAFSELVENKHRFDDERLKKIRKDFNVLRDRFSKPQIKEIRKNI